LSLDRVCFELAHGDLKKVKQKVPEAFTSLSQAELPSAEVLPPGDRRSFSWNFSLSKNCPISDTGQSLCILFGLRDAVPRAHLQLPVIPHADIEGILGIFETSFQFAQKSQKSRADCVVAKFKAPTGARYKMLEELDLSLGFQDGKLALDYVFKVKQFNAGPSTLEVKTKKKNFSQSVNREQYYSPAGFVDSKLVEPLIEEALAKL
jgi:hypothetical protein